MSSTYSASILSRTAKRMYAAAPWFRAMVQSLRPYICPFELIVPVVPAGSRVLDVGCGSGLLLGLLAASGRQIRGVGFDSSGSAIRVAGAMKEAAVAMGPGSTLEFLKRDVGEAWPEGEFDVVALIDVLHHVRRENQKKLLTESLRHTRAGGLLICKEMASDPWHRAVWNGLHDLVWAGDWPKYVGAGEVKAWAREAGGVIEDESRHTRLLYEHYMVVVRKPG